MTECLPGSSVMTTVTPQEQFPELGSSPTGAAEDFLKGEVIVAEMWGEEDKGQGKVLLQMGESWG